MSEQLLTRTAEHRDLHDNLNNSVLLGGLSPEERHNIIKAGHWLEFSQGEHVYLQGDNDQHFYMIESGRVELLLDAGSNGRLSVSQIGPGGHFGETSLLTGNNRSLSVLALTPLRLLAFDLETFNTILLSQPVIQHRLNISLAKRLRLSFQDHANSLTWLKSHRQETEHLLDPSFFPASSPLDSREQRLTASTIHNQVNKAVKQFANSTTPLLITGETGTGRRLIAGEIHKGGQYNHGPYREADIRNIDPAQMELELFGYGKEPLAFSQLGQLGLLELAQGGTAVLYNAECLEPDVQRQLARTITKNTFSRVGGETAIPLRTRIILICKDDPRQTDGQNRLLPELYSLFAGQHFRAVPLREHRRDIPRLVEFYLKRYSLKYGKNISAIDDQTLGKLINYDWPGNLTEMASVLQRAVVLGRSNQPLTDEILLGVPRSEGKWELNLLRFKPIRSFLLSRLFPVLPRIMVGGFFLLVLATLFFGPRGPHDNVGLILSWVVGWPLMIFAFFFLARTWCSICGLSVPGWLAQLLIKPERPTPKVIRHYSGWIMTTLCILLFWIETTWNAYESPRLTAWIITAITCGSLLFSIFYKRRVWCRYVCPLGAINALFSMPSILELRANTQMCLNRCGDHACYTGDDNNAGCPMFRHPFLVDNNRDCILCGQCIKNCKLNSIHLNLRLAPQELWNQENPRLSDSILVVSLAAIFFPFIVSQNFPGFIQLLASSLQHYGLPHNHAFAATLLFVATVAFYLGGYGILSRIIASATACSFKNVAAIFGYGMIPLVLGAFMAAHLEILVRGIWLLPATLIKLFGANENFAPARSLSPDITFMLQSVTVFGGLIASLYANWRIVGRLTAARKPRTIVTFLPALLLCLSAAAYLGLMQIPAQ
ncbi:sigma 54-interacting transcriptional regulator [Desulfopila aestuarii]|uniref:4Fe-4S binding domain-containing protein n=1 Tax=Desulfopila aestuarii DSM 18488 TaxID=1121416 RepID=A0A1M7XZL8_9BACT|nr:sigma 54-interacting transcriptional regulator [Desulfopila aestuarii]SHO44683.1 4Fe-4S binding domain-containing protein [Desulfopila aestuarii DSM 18488]